MLLRGERFNPRDDIVRLGAPRLCVRLVRVVVVRVVVRHCKTVALHVRVEGTEGDVGGLAGGDETEGPRTDYVGLCSAEMFSCNDALLVADKFSKLSKANRSHAVIQAKPDHASREELIWILL